MYKKILILILLLATLHQNINAQCSATVCAGSTTNSACLLSLVSNLVAGTWNSSNTAVATVNSSGTITGVSGGTATISYHFILFYTVSVTVNPQPTASPTNNGPVCSGQTLSFDAHASGASVYAWIGPNGFVSTGANPSITGATPSGTGTYSLTATTALGCSASFTESAIVGTPFTMSVSETSPLTLSGEKIHTFCSGQTLTLAVSGSPSLPSSGITYTWSGPATATTTSSLFSPSFTTGSNTTVIPYTVAATYHGCSAIAKDTVVVPATGNSPCEYYKVNGYRSIAGLSALSGCSDCNTIQPFHTVLSSALDNTAIQDSSNYYIVNNATFKRSSYSRDMFFMNNGVQLLVDTVTAVTLSTCHFFSSPASWGGIRVAVSGTSAGQLSIGNNTLIENTGGTVNGNFVGGIYVAATGNYYNTAGMTDIINSNAVIYNRNYLGAAIYNYTPATSIVDATTPLPFTFTNSVFANRELASANTGTTSATNYPFSWQPASALKATTVPGANPLYGIGAYTSYSVAATGHAGIFLSNTGNKQLISAGTSTTPATYSYNYMNIGSAATDTAFVKANLFDSLDFGVQLQGANALLYNNTFSNVRLSGLWLDNDKNDVQVIGDTATHTNNRFYNNGFGIFIGGTGSVWDFTCTHAIFSGVNIATNITPNTGIYIVKGNGHNKYNVSNNTIYNYGIGTYLQYVGFDPYSYLNGTTLFRNNYITGKTTSSGTESMTTGIKVVDLRAYTGSNGNIYVDSNILSGVNDGISLYSYTQNIHINYNLVNMVAYSSSYTQSGISCSYSPWVNEVKNNTVTGFGYDCSPYTYGITMRASGDTTNIADISCNRVADMNTGFEFELTNHLLWANNEMKRNQIGMHLANSGSIGTQGSDCAPIDNHWEGDTCSSCSSCSVSWPGWNGSGIFHTYADDNIDPSASILYVRNSTHYMPSQNGAYTTSTAYSLSTGTLLNSSTACSTGLPAISNCSDNSPAARKTSGATMVKPVEPTTASVNYSIYPNPNDGSMTIALSGNSNAEVRMSIINTVGAVVYTGQLQFINGHASVSLQQLLVPGVYIAQFTNGNVSNYKRIVVAK